MFDISLDSIREQLATLTDEERAAIFSMAERQVKQSVWLPNPGPQTAAYFSPADITLYGGQGGGGKSDLLLGLGLTAHRNTLIMRRNYPNLNGLTRRISEIAGRKGLKESPPPRYQTEDNRIIEFGAANHPDDEQAFQGQPHDLLGFDEATQFLLSQVRFLMGWVRSTDRLQRKRTVFATNPPLDSAGFWIIGMFRPWLDLTHPNPAKPGELRWFITDENGQDVEVSCGDPISRQGKVYYPTSRTFIPAALRDNPYLVDTGYQAQLDALPEPVRSAVRDGNFMAARSDAEFQVIPTLWVIQAQSRWRENAWRDVPMTAMAIDPAGGGRDSAEIAIRHGGWYDRLISQQGNKTSDGNLAVSTIVKHRRNGCPVVVDVGGGYGGQVIMRLGDNGIPFHRFDGGSASGRRTVDGSMHFANKRAEAWWRFREELDPEQQGGSHIALPPDPELLADLTTPVWKVSSRGILIEDKDSIRKKLGRSTGKGDAVVMALSPGNTAAQRFNSFSKAVPRVIESRSSARRRK